jgi:ankyrin repeat protein
MSVALQIEDDPTIIEYETTNFLESVTEVADADGLGPLHIAAQLGDTAAVAALLENGAQIEALDNDGRTPLVLAIVTGHLETARLFCEHGARTSTVPKPWLGDQADPVLRGRRVSGLLSREIATPLHAAAANGGEEFVRLLLDRKASVNVKNGMYQTPLHVAANYGQIAAVEVLLEHGACCDSRDEYGDTPLMVACASSSSAVDDAAAIAEIFLAGGADAIASNGVGESALHCAAWRGNEDAVRLLLDAGGTASVDLHGEMGESALHCAAQQGHVSVICQLIENNAAATTANRYGITAVDAAQSNGHEDAARLLTLLGGQACTTRRRRRHGVSWPDLARPSWLRLPRIWKAAARTLSPLEQKLLVFGDRADGIPSDALLRSPELLPKLPYWFQGSRSALTGAETARLVRIPQFLDAAACKALRDVVDRQAGKDLSREMQQVNLDRDGFEEIVGDAVTRKLWGLANECRARVDQRVRGNEAQEHSEGTAQLVALFVRKYTTKGFPWFEFHTVVAVSVTVNVALSDEAEVIGGEYLACADGAIQGIKRDEGEALVHSSSLVHGVSRTHRGERYSLIAFFAGW